MSSFNTFSSVHHLPIEKVFEFLKTSPEGLSNEEVERRRKTFGSNRLPTAKRFSFPLLALKQFRDPLVIVLGVAFGISVVSQHFLDAGIVLVAIFLNAIVGCVQEYKANQALEKLKKLVEYKTKVLRDGREIVVNHEVVVPGDIIVLAPGDKVPADARILLAKNLEIIESTLTGESLPSSKQAGMLSEGIPLADRENMVFWGTVVARGTARAVVSATGARTELGRIANLVRETEEETTPLQQELRRVGRMIGLILIGLNILLFILGVAGGKPWFEMLLTSVAIVVAAVPEGLLAAMTVILAVGMKKLAERQGLVRNLLAAETLGSVTVICSDKTGTLTEGVMKVAEVVTSGEKKGGPEEESKRLFLLKIGVFCNDAVVENPQAQHQDWKIVGDPTDRALLIAGAENKIIKEDLFREEPRLGEIPFDTEYKFMATLHRGKDRDKIYVKGAPEKILSMSQWMKQKGEIIKFGDVHRRAMEQKSEGLAEKGFRVLAMAYLELSSRSRDATIQPTGLQNLTFVGFVALRDPLRSDAKETLATCERAGIRLVVMTGDHPNTARTIVQELGVEVRSEDVVTGEVLDQWDGATFVKNLRNVRIFARVEPRQKIRIVSGLKNQGEVVAMLGDGVNDAPALKKADIGVALGSGTDVAKENADLILLDDRFQTVVRAVRRGRMTFLNIQKVVLYLLVDSFSEMVLVGGAVILGFPLPILPAQILWINLIEDILPAVALAFEEIEEGVMEDPPRKKGSPILGRVTVKFIVLYTVVIDLVLFGMFLAIWRISGNLDHARTVAFAGLGVASLFSIYSVRGFKRSVFTLNPFSNSWLNVAILFGMGMLFLAIQLPFFQETLRTVPLRWSDWGMLAGYGMLSILVYEWGKKMFR